MPKVSVIIPVYNVEKYLRQCLDSVVNQTLKDIEIICVNDGSTDNSLTILNEYAAKDKRFIVISQENQGVSVARNNGLDKAVAEYVQFVDADDFIENDCIEKAYKKIVSTKTDIICFGSQDLKNNKVKVNDNINFLNYLVIANNSYVTSEEDKTKLIHAVWDKLYKKSFLDFNNIRFSPNLKVTEDGVFNLQCLINKSTFSVLNYIGYNRIDTGVSTTANKYAAALKAIDALQYVLESDLYLYSSKKTKMIIFEKMIESVLYYYDSKSNFLNKLLYINEIEKVHKYIDKEIEKDIIQQSISYKKLEYYNKKKFLLENLFCIKNKYTNKKIYKHICILGIKINIEIKNHIAKKQNEVQNYLVKNYIKPYLKNKSESYIIPPKHPELRGRKIIWQYWGQGLNESTPTIVRICLNSVKEYRGEYTQIILTDKNISEYIDIPKFVFKKLYNGEFSYAFFSDILRLCLLAAYGGIWVDATVLFTDNLPNEINKQHFFTYQRNKQSIYKKECEKYNKGYFSWSRRQRVNWLSSFIKADSDYPLILVLRDIALNYAKNENTLKHYFLVHLIFDYLTKYTIYKKYNCYEYDDTVPHLMQLNFDNKFSSELWFNIIQQTPIHKLTYFKELKLDSIGSYLLKEKCINV